MKTGPTCPIRCAGVVEFRAVGFRDLWMELRNQELLEGQKSDGDGQGRRHWDWGGESIPVDPSEEPNGLACGSGTR